MSLTWDQLARKRRHAVLAQQLRDNEVFGEMITDLKHQVISNWSTAALPETRENLWRDLQAIGRLEGHLKWLGEDYRKDMHRLEEREEREKRQQEDDLRGR